MAVKIWIGAGQNIAQVNSLTLSAATVGATVTIGCNGKGVTVSIVTGDTLPTVYQKIAQAWNSNPAPEIRESSASVPTTNDKVLFTASIAGRPFTNTTSTTGGPTATYTSVTANKSATDWADTANWLNASVPAVGDDVYITGTSGDILLNLSAHSGFTLASLHITSSFTGRIGQHRINRDYGDGYQEYRPRYLSIRASKIFIGEGDGRGSSRIYLDAGTVATEVTVQRTGQPEREGVGSFVFAGTNALSNKMFVKSGSVSAGYDPDVGYLLNEITLGTSGGLVGQASLNLHLVPSVAVGVSKCKVFSGSLISEVNFGTLTQSSGVCEFSGTVTNLDISRDGLAYGVGSGTITNATISDRGTLDFSKSLQARVITNLTMRGDDPGLIDSGGTLTITNPATFPDGVPRRLDLGKNYTLGLTRL